MTDRSDIQIRPAQAWEIRSLRHRVLRAGLPIEEADFDNDYAATTFHVAAVAEDGSVVGCATIMHGVHDEMLAWRLRGMAVDPGFQRFGIGRRLLARCDEHAIEHGPLQLWCNARTPAIPFYRSLGWTQHGDEFDIPTAGPHYRMTKLLLKP